MPVDAPHIVVVLGMHRAGTSLAARALTCMGVDLGNDLVPRMAGVNDTGFWEDRTVVEFNEELLRRMGRAWDALAPIAREEFRVHALSGMQERALSILMSKIDRQFPFGLKDPRMARLMPFWVDVFALGSLRPAYLLAVRDPCNVVRSLAVRDGFNDTKSELLWLGHTVDAVLDTAPCASAGSAAPDRVVVDYDVLVDQPMVQLRRIAEGLGLRLDAELATTFSNDFLDPALRHHQLARPAPHSRRSQHASMIYEGLHAVATGRGSLSDPDHVSRLGKARSWLEDISPLLSYTSSCERSLQVCAASDANGGESVTSANAILAQSMLVEPIGNQMLDEMVRSSATSLDPSATALLNRLLLSESDLHRATAERNAALRDRDAANEANVAAHVALESERISRADLQELSNRAHAALEVQRRSIESLLEVRATLEGRLTAREAELAMLQADLGTSRSQRDHFESELRLAERELSDVLASFARMEQGRLALIDRVGEMERELARDMAERERAGVLHDATARALARLKHETTLDRARASIAWQAERSARDATQKDLMRHRMALDAMRAELRDIHQSLSWRVLAGMHRLLKLPLAIGGRRARATIEARAIHRSGLFDSGWYLRTNPDVAAKRLDAALHYVLHGEAEGRRPTRDFDPATYLRDNPDVACAGGNAFVHFLTRGRRELRSTSQASESGFPGIQSRDAPEDS